MIHIKNYNNFSISKNRYYELKYFCLQYQDLKRQLKELTEIGSPSFEEIVSNSNIADNTFKLAVKKIRLSNAIDIIDKCIAEVANDLASYLSDNVTRNINYKYLDIPMSRRNFYYMRKKFFWTLDQKI